MKRDDTVYLNHIRDACDRIASYLQGISSTIFNENPLLQDGVIRQIEIIGEAIKRVSKELRSPYPEIRADADSVAAICKVSSRAAQFNVMLATPQSV
jgi:uncharacterized protein with HEPN domain